MTKKSRIVTKAHQAITTKYVGPTNTRGARIFAKTASGERFTIAYHHGASPLENHCAAAEITKALFKKDEE